MRLAPQQQQQKKDVNQLLKNKRVQLPRGDESSFFSSTSSSFLLRISWTNKLLKKNFVFFFPFHLC